jgi:hypothetical protein
LVPALNGMRSGTVSMPVMIIFEDLSHEASRSHFGDGLLTTVPGIMR